MIRVILMVGSSLFIVTSLCRASLVFSDAFNYSVGSDLGGQGSWANVNSGDQVKVASGNLSVSGLLPSSGNMVTFGGAGIDPQRPFTAQSTTLYYSFAFQISDLGSLNTAGGYFGGLGSSSTLFGATVWTRKNGTGFDIGIGKRSAVPSDVIWSSSAYLVNSVVFVVGRYVFNPSAGDDLANLWINPASSSFGALTAPSGSIVTSTAGTDLASIDRFFLRQDSTTATPGTINVDELRVGTSWADVTPVPEPTTWFAGIGASLALLGMFVRRARA